MMKNLKNFSENVSEWEVLLKLESVDGYKLLI